MRSLYEKMKMALSDWSRRYVCDEDPDERRRRLQQEAFEEIHAQALHVVQLRMAMQATSEPNYGLVQQLKEAA